MKGRSVFMLFGMVTALPGLIYMALKSVVPLFTHFSAKPPKAPQAPRRFDFRSLPGAASYRSASEHQEMFEEALQFLTDCNFVSAEAAYRKLIELEDESASHIGLGAALYYQRKVVAAEKAYRKALEREPASVQALIGLGSLAHSRGNAGEAREFYRKALEIKPDDECGLWGLALAYEGLNERDNALRQYELFLEKAPKSALAAKVEGRIRALRSSPQN